jgi:hypothetical protein
MANKDSGGGSSGEQTTGNTARPRNAYCSFCRKSYRDVGPLVEGPDNVYICGECIDLCQRIIEQEKARRQPGDPLAYLRFEVERLARLAADLKFQMAQLRPPEAPDPEGRPG